MKESTKEAFRLWLRYVRQNSDRVITDKISRCGRVECYYGDMDELFDQGRIEPLLDELRCAPSGEPCHRIPIDHVANQAKSTADFKNAVAAYLEFRRAQ
ncbi:MAG: hypothetical protein OXI73_09780 [Rhodospirillales bacterium]|nr:hypothetical protein [Rhodospirillales bacterium]